MLLELLVAGVILLALIAYGVLGGADFGGGVWDLLASGSPARRQAQRDAIAHAMGPVWEANHVWLIFVAILLFTAFPAAFGILSATLFLPFHLVLVGITLRGVAFVFRGPFRLVGAPGPAEVWGRIFGAASMLTPLLLGVALAAITSGALPAGPPSASAPWLTPFGVAVGLLTLAVCAYLAAVYLTVETEREPDVQEDFRRRALWTGAVMTFFAAAAPVVASYDAPRFWQRLTNWPAAAVILAGVVLAALSAFSVATRRFRLARVLAGGLVVVLLLGWALAQFPYLVYPHLTLRQAAAPAASLRFLLWTMVPGALLLIPSLAFLFRVFSSMHPPERGAET